MTNFIPYEKLSKKKKKELDAKKRNTWNGLNPVTRKPDNSRAYNRNKEKVRNRRDFDSAPQFSLYVYN